MCKFKNWTSFIDLKTLCVRVNEFVRHEFKLLSLLVGQRRRNNCFDKSVKFRIATTMEALPVEILSEIFSYLSVRELLKTSEVCTKFCSVVNARKFLDKMLVNLTEPVCFHKSMRSYVNCKIVKAKNDRNRNILELGFRNPKVFKSSKYLKLDDLEFFNSRALKNLMNTFDNIQVLHLEGVHLKSQSISDDTIKLPNIKVLKFLYCTNDLLRLFSDVKHINVLKICLIPHENEKNRQHNYRLVLRILVNNQQSLVKLNFYDMNFEDSFLDLVSSSTKLHRLKKLSMSFNSNLSPNSEGFQKFVSQHAETLEKYKIRTFDHITQSQLRVLINSAVNIKSLNLIICSSCDYATFTDFKNLHKLEKLKIQPTNYCNSGNVRYEKFIEDKILNLRNENMKCLELVMLPLSDAILHKIVSMFPNLLRLKLTSSISSVDFIPKYVTDLKKKLKSIKELIIDGQYL